ncbi:MAG: peptidyl-prolyl cis-trans isomerase [Armatimonadetes bacterium]|nr:peptidyl-prolyl cis-trans isomerase [Armatimonadota bacterium]
MRSSLWRYAAASALTLFLAVSYGCGKRGVGTVNGTKISQDTFNKRLQRFPTNPAVQFPPPMQQQVATSVLGSLINETLVLDLAKKEGVEPTEKQVEERQKEMNAALSDQNRNLNDLLQNSGMTTQELGDRLKPEIAQINILAKYVKVSDADVKKTYDEAIQQGNRSRFYIPQSVKLSAIVTDTRQKALDAKKAIDSGVAFGTAAEKYSDDVNTKKSRGEIGWVSKPDQFHPAPQGVPPDIFTHAFALKDGQVSAPFQTGNNWVVLKAESVRPSRMQPLDHVKTVIRTVLLQQKAGGDKKLQDLMKNMVKNADVKITLPGYDQFFKQYMENLKKAQDQSQILQPPLAPGAGGQAGGQSGAK